MLRARRRNYWILPLLAAAGGVGLLMTGGAGIAAAADDDAAERSLKAFSEVFDAVEQNFAEEVDPSEAIYKGAIPGMLRMLDPHSSFFDPEAYRAMREDQRGTYYGVGMEVRGLGDRTIVFQPFRGSPALRAGIRPGDTIEKVDDTITTGLTVTEIADLLRGRRGTDVQVQVSRPNLEDPLQFTITRDEIPRYSVAGGYYVSPGVGYIKINSFNENTNQEMVAKLRDLDESNMRGLVLDLRDNPGGLLTQGVDVASHFLSKGEVVVFHNGRSSAYRNYAARTDGTGKDYPVVILVNRSTASAAEIVSGALQDHDRAWILGENTFGKGLVQTVYPMGDTTALALTTAHYFTPSGRLIQRDYSNVSFLDYYTHSDLEVRNEEDVKMTDSGRTVYGGGGITPDEQWEPLLANEYQIALLRSEAIFNFTAEYFGPRDTDLTEEWVPTDAFMGSFRAYLDENDVEYTEEQFLENLTWTRAQLKRQTYALAFDEIARDRVGIEADPEVAAAVASMSKATELLESAKDMLVQRMNSQDATGAAVR